ncbi:hypothetical protein HPP92_003071 [Vanilla planifolia]|uniref:Pentatricopeptide repeat-containing protein n=1 Tax=Vanilla planifolia TaxID=51239 RepID=A0A835S2L0_VANPL|nr:hypothetical protein HPP92_003071 [Vanilla planifolia]
MSFYRRLLLLHSATDGAFGLRRGALFSVSRPFAFSSAEEAAAERRRRKRRLRIEPPLHALRRDPNAPRPPRDPNAPRLPDSTSALVGNRLSLHNRVQTLIRSGELDAASVHARHSVFSSVRPTVFTCNAIMASMHRAARHDDAVALFHFFFVQHNVVPNVVSYNVLINTHCDAGRVDTALDVYRHILANAPFSPSPVTYRHLTKGLINVGRITEALDLLREMLSRGHGADSLVYNNLIAGFIDLGNMDKAIELFDELRERCLVYDGVVHATFMEAYWKLGKDKEAMESYQSLIDRQFKMIPATCNVLLETLLKHDKVAEANKLFEHMLDEHKPPVFMALNTETYNIMVNRCFQEGNFAQAIEVFHKTGLKPLAMDAGCYGNIIGKLCQNLMMSEAEKLYEEMLSKSINPDTATYGFLVDACFADGRVEDALSYFDKLVSSGEGYPKPVREVYNKIFDGLIKDGCLGQAMDIFSKMGERELKPDAVTYEILVAGLCKAGDLDHGRALLEEMVRGGIRASSELCSIVSDTFVKAGQGEDVELLLTGKKVPICS